MKLPTHTLFGRALPLPARPTLAQEGPADRICRGGSVLTIDDAQRSAGTIALLSAVGGSFR